MTLEQSSVKRMQDICLAFPEAVEKITWGSPHFRVKDKIFAGIGNEDGEFCLGFKLEKPHAAELVECDPHCKPSKFGGQHGWVSVKVTEHTNWDMVKDWVRESYTLIAPKSLSKLLD